MDNEKTYLDTASAASVAALSAASATAPPAAATSAATAVAPPVATTSTAGVAEENRNGRRRRMLSKMKRKRKRKRKVNSKIIIKVVKRCGNVWRAGYPPNLKKRAIDLSDSGWGVVGLQLVVFLVIFADFQ